MFEYFSGVPKILVPDNLRRGVKSWFQWYVSIGDNTVTDAILDRLMHNALNDHERGRESMRKQ